MMLYSRSCGFLSIAECTLLSRNRPFSLFAKTHTTPVRRFGHLIREVDSRGFRADLCVLRHKNSASTQRLVADCLHSKSNVLFCGAHHTGKMTILRALGEASERQRRRVAYVSADPQRAARLNALLLYHFLGMRYMGGREELPSRDQLEGALERHVRLSEATYAACLPNLLTADVLILDGVEHIEPTVMLSIDAVCRRLRDRKREAFGGLRVFAGADFWQLPVHPCSDTGGYVYQLDTWNELFPQQRLLERIHGQDRRLTELVNRAYYGLLREEDIEELQSCGAKAKLSSGNKNRSSTREKTPGRAGSKTGNGDDDDKDEAVVSSSGGDSGIALPRQSLISNVDAVIGCTPRFPKQASVRVPPPRFRTLKRTEIGNFIVNTLAQSSMAHSFGLVDALNVEVGSSVHVLHNALAPIGIAAGTIGEVLQVRDHVLVVHFPSLHRTVDVPRMRISVYHSFYPEVRYEIQQFPLFPRYSISPTKVISYPHAFNIHIDCHRLADTNDLGNILARMRSFNDFTIEHVQDYVRVDGMVHEPTRIYYQRIANRPLSPASEQWCRNCKTYISTADFYEHWDQCIRQVRWCSECNTRIPLERLEPHREKHQIVLCMDCGRAVEWRQWEGHRLTCTAMMREVSPENDFLPLRTRQLALEMGLDKRDLHTMRAFSRSLLPKSRKQWSGSTESLSK